jgi:hypothetical protein
MLCGGGTERRESMGLAPRVGGSVSFRLDVSAQPGRAVVSIQGHLAAAAVHELERVCRDPEGTLILDMTYLMSADDLGVQTLKRLRADGAQFISVSPYMALLLCAEQA